jgi:hypothetical protein
MADDEQISEAGRKARFERWEELGLDRVKADLLCGGHRLVGGPPAVHDLAWEWVRMKEAEHQQTSPPAQQKTELLTLKPTIWGIGIDLKELGRRIRDFVTTAKGGDTASIIFSPRQREKERKRHSSEAAMRQTEENISDIDARVAFYEILANSEWSRQQRPGTKQPISDWLVRQLDREIHNQLRQGRLTAWGCRCLTTTAEAPESQIPADEWENIEIDFTPLNPNFPRTSAMRRVRSGGFNTVYAGARFCKNQIYGNFPLIAPNTTPTPTGAHPDWPIQELFYHIKPDLLENADEAAWETIGNDLRDEFALNLVKVWGRPIGDGIGKMLGERPVLRLIDSSYWHSAHFTFNFFDDTAGDAPHTYTEPHSNLPDYTDLRVNRAEAETTWRR